MNTKFILTFCLLCSTLFGCSNAPKNKMDDSQDWLPISIASQEKIISDYVDALDEFAQVVPLFDDDTEALWAADTVHTMAVTLKNDHCPLTKSLASICQMQNYTGYGMAYFNAILASNKDPQSAAFALSIIPKNDSVYNALSNVDFGDVKNLVHYQIISINNMQLFNTLNRINNDLPIDREISYTLYCMSVIDSIANLKDYTKAELFKVSSDLECYSYFQMIGPLLKMFSGTKEKFDANSEVVIEAATHYDLWTNPIFQSVRDRRKIEVMSDSDFETWMITAWQHKVKLMRLLTRLVKEWDEEKK